MRIVAYKHYSPPMLAELLAGWALDEGERYARLGDLEERFQYLVTERGGRKARSWYRRQVLHLIILAIIQNILWSYIMFKNNLIVAWRNIKKGKVYSILNTLGLTAGMAIFILIMLFVWNELSYDRFHKHAALIYRLDSHVSMENRELGVYSVPAPLGPALAAEFPEVVRATRLINCNAGIVTIGDRLFEEPYVLYAEPSVFDVFSITVMKGDPRTMLAAPLSLVLTEETAEKWFGTVDPMGKMIKLGSQQVFNVTGIIKKMPSNSHLKFNMLASFETISQKVEADSWGAYDYMTYIQLAGNSSTEGMAKKYENFLMDKMPDQLKQGTVEIRLTLMPLASIHFGPHLNDELEPPGNPAFIQLLVMIALFILLIAYINFVNLSTARAGRRAKEVGMRKVIGSKRQGLVFQFLGESVLISVIGFILAVGLVILLRPVFNQLIAHELSLDLLRSGSFLMILGCSTLTAGLFAGLYPALYMSSFRPIEALEVRFKSGRPHSHLRNVLVVVQYVISICLIFSVLVIISQLRYIENFDLGYNKNQVLEIPLRGSVADQVQAFKSELLSQPGVLRAATSSLSFTFRHPPEQIFSFEGEDVPLELNLPVMAVDADFLETLEIDLAVGRNFQSGRTADSGSLIINETLAHQLGWKEPLGKTIQKINVDQAGRTDIPFTVIGVIRDFNFASLREEIKGHLLRFEDGLRSRVLYVKLRSQDLKETLSLIEKIWRRIEPAYPFHANFLDDAFDQIYRAEIRMSRIFIGLALIAIFIACLGLVGLSSFTAEQRTKEIGIRKVLGASTSGVIVMLSRDFMKWVIIANLIAWPIGYFVMRAWLQNFAYRTSLTLLMFLGAGLTAIIIAAAVIILQTYKAASANPANSIRYE